MILSTKKEGREGRKKQKKENGEEEVDNGRGRKGEGSGDEKMGGKLGRVLDCFQVRRAGQPGVGRTSCKVCS